MPDAMKPAPAGPTDHESAPVADNPNPEIIADATPATPEPIADAEPAPVGPTLSPREQRMKAIADKVKAGRGGIEATGDFSDPMQNYGNLARPPEPEPQPAAEPAAAPAAGEQPRKFKVKVRHEERELTEEELIANAQKALAAENYLEDGRKFFEQGKQFLETVQRSAASRPHQDATRAQEDVDPVPEPSADPHQDGTDFEKLIEEIQIGDTKEAAGKLRAAVTQAARDVARATSIDDRVRADWSNTMTTFEKFKADNTDLAADPNALAVMERMIYDGYRDDLRELGVSDDALPKDPLKLADAHRLARVSGQKVRTTEQLLNTVKDGYQKWRGVTPAPSPTQSPAPQTLRVNVDRTERRQAIPTQPTRSTAPSQTVPNATPQPRTRSQTVMEMKKARGQVTA